MKGDENTLSFVVRLDAVMTDFIILLESTFLDGSRYIDVKVFEIEEDVDLNSKTLRRRKGALTSQGSAGHAKQVLLTASGQRFATLSKKT